MTRSTVPSRPERTDAATTHRRGTNLEVRAVTLTRRHGPLALRLAVAVVVIWFGVLKITGDTPVAALVLDTVEAPTGWTLPGWFVPAFGAFEVAVGLALLTGRGLRLVVPVLAAHLLATFAVFVTQPDVAFVGGNPLLLTVEGEFVAKNLVLLVAVLVAGAHTRSPRPDPPHAEEAPRLSS